ncbi:hypothetical protein [Salinibacterium sp. NSLL17]|nr:hypothetical protein [Salinibacterium sp. NSLL17]
MTLEMLTDFVGLTVLEITIVCRVDLQLWWITATVVVLAGAS